MADNGVEDNVTVYTANSRDSRFVLPEEVTVIVSETMDCCGFGEGILPTMLDAIQRHTTPVSQHRVVCIPQKVSALTRITLCRYNWFYNLLNLNRCILNSFFVTRIVFTRRLTPTYEEKVGASILQLSFISEGWAAYTCVDLDDYEDARQLSGPTNTLSVNIQSLVEVVESMSGIRTARVPIVSLAEGDVHAVTVHFV